MAWDKGQEQALDPCFSKISIYKIAIFAGLRDLAPLNWIRGFPHVVVGVFPEQTQHGLPNRGKEHMTKASRL